MRHLHRTAFPGTDRQGRCVAVQVSNLPFIKRLLTCTGVGASVVGEVALLAKT